MISMITSLSFNVIRGFSVSPEKEATIVMVYLYRPQHSCGKVMFSRVSLQAFVCPQGGGGCLADTAPKADKPPPEQTPTSRPLPREQTPPGADTPGSRHLPEQIPRADNPREQTPPGSRHTPPPRQETATAVNDTHPTGWRDFLKFRWIRRIGQNYSFHPLFIPWPLAQCWTITLDNNIHVTCKRTWIYYADSFRNS